MKCALLCVVYGFVAVVVAAEPLELEGVLYPVSSQVSYYDAQPFFEYNDDFDKYHLGSDINALDLDDCGDPVFAMGVGEVVFVGNGGIGWGNVVIIKHNLGNGQYISSLYGHLRSFAEDLEEGAEVDHVTILGFIGSADSENGSCGSAPHLHFEVRYGGPESNKVECDETIFPFPNSCTGPGYAESAEDSLVPEYLDPACFIEAFNPEDLTALVPCTGLYVANGGCVPQEHEYICRVCVAGKACGNSCINEAYTCRRMPGCAVDVENLCPE